ncbi:MULTISPECIES: glycosyltransferase family 2 protein [unclassified Amycolatopsis]|uniref:glycosyltransferase family 2 protein n=1 Tax=unclassified Amycolatopsis TaxID=2618356 RepID=UPI00106F05E7|nr:MULTISPECIES: glycosyltransferase family 2 protein [unclassified Amycolatopsis]
MSEQRFRVAIVIVTYNSADVLPGCLASLRDAAKDTCLVDVVVADNVSSDDTAEIAKRGWDVPVTLVQTGRNGGYAAAVNAAIEDLRNTELDGIFVLNPDARPQSGAIAVLANALEYPRRGIVYPRLLNADGSLQPSIRRDPTVLRALVESIFGGSRAGRWGTMGELITDPMQYEYARPVAWGTGAAMLIGADALREIGLWDESFLLYGEETEYSLRAKDFGWQPWYEPAAVVEHIGGESGTNPVLWALLTVNRVKLFRRRRGRLSSAAYFAAVVLGEFLRSLGGRRTARAALVALVRPSRRLTALSA